MAEYNESQINSNETERISAEQQRINNEAQRQTKETEREAREATRQSNESTRISKEAERLAAEVNRQEAEATRVSNERSRVEAENNRDIRLTELENEVNALGTELRGVDEEIQNDVTEIQRDITYSAHLSSEVVNDYKFRVNAEKMMSSLMTLNNIEGLSSVETNSQGNKEIVSRSVNHICTIDKSKNYFDDAVQDTLHGDTTTTTRENNDITVISNTQYGAVAYSIPNLEEGKKYCILCDDIIITQGDAHFQIATPVEYKPLRSTTYLKSSHYNAVITGNEICTVTFHCSRVSNSGDVTYKNVQIYEVKEMIAPDIQLNSLPNGVRDEVKDGMLIKRTKRFNLADLTWVPSSTNNQFPQSEFVVYYSKSVPDLIVDPDAWENELGEILCNNIPSVPIKGTASAQPGAETDSAGISGHMEWSELRIKLYRADVPDLQSLSTWLTNNNVHAVYELETPEYIPVNLTIKADKGDTVVINTTKTMDLTYDIQLNTKAQIDAIQETVAHTVDSITSELRDNIDGLKYELKYDPYGNGCYTLPGGLMIQFGYIAYPANTYSDTIDFIITFPAPFPNQVISFMTSMSGGDNGWDSRVSGHALSNSQARVVMRGINNTIVNTMYWFAIGR